ncbi:hypothetical protein CC79DRAFT_1352549 [Sarocladium strictum]
MSRRTRPRDGLGRRKACDYCCRKKLRCDGGTPTCSTCNLRHIDCTWTPDVAAPKTASTSQTELLNEVRFGDIESRLAALETQIQAGVQLPLVNALPPPLEWTWDNDLMIDSLPTPTTESTTDLTSRDSLSIAPISRSGTRNYELPPWDEVYNLVRYFLHGPNEAMPIYDTSSFMRMLHSWRRNPEDRDDASWALINAVLALSAQQQGHSEIARDSLQRAQSVLNSMVTRDEDLKGIQLLLTLIAIFIGTPHPQPICFLIATAVKLAHRLKLHDREARGTVDAELALQMDRLFRITYIYDRDISLRAVEPYAQDEDDYDKSLLEASITDDGAGHLEVEGVQIDYLHLRSQLAKIQGLTYRTTFSVKGRRLTADQKQLAAEHIDDLVDSWQSEIPLQLRAEQLIKKDTSFSTARGYLMSLHLVAYQARFLAHRISARNPDWIHRLTEYSDQFANPADSQTHRPTSASITTMLLIPRWTTFLRMARTCLQMIRILDANTVSMIWSTLCSYQTALVILIANRLTIWEHKSDDGLHTDAVLIKEAVQHLHELITRQDSGEPVTVLMNAHQAATELNRRANIAVQRFKEDTASSKLLF